MKNKEKNKKNEVLSACNCLLVGKMENGYINFSIVCQDINVKIRFLSPNRKLAYKLYKAINKD